MIKTIRIATGLAVLSGLMFVSCWKKEVNGYYFQMNNGEISTLLPFGSASVIAEYGESLEAIFARPEMSFKLVSSNALAERREVGEDQFFIEYYRDCSSGSNLKKIDAIKIPIPDWGSYQIKYIPKDMPEWEMTISFYIEASPKPFYTLGMLSKKTWAQDETPPAPPSVANFTGALPDVIYYYISAETWNNATEEQKADPEAWRSETEEILFYDWPDGPWQIEPGEYYLAGYVLYPNIGDKEYPDVNYFGYTKITENNRFSVTAPAATP